MDKEYIYLNVNNANVHKLFKIVRWCQINGYKVRYNENGAPQAGWHVSFSDANNPVGGQHFVTISFDEISDEERLLLELRWTGQ